MNQQAPGSLLTRILPDGRVVAVTVQTYSKARITVGKPGDFLTYEHGY